MWPTFPTAYLVTQLTARNGSTYQPGGGPNASIRLFVNDVTPDANSIAAQFTEPTFTGYAAVNLTMDAVSLNNTNVPVSQSNLVRFQPSADGGTDQAYGIFITTAAGVLIAAERFDAPIPMQVTTSAVTGVWRVSEPASNYGWLSVE
jgi:hypothetical protein